MEFGVPLSCIHKENKTAYIAAIVKSEEADDLTPFRDFMFTEHINTLKTHISEYESSINADVMLDKKQHLKSSNVK